MFRRSSQRFVPVSLTLSLLVLSLVSVLAAGPVEAKKATAAGAQDPAPAFDESLLQALEWREVGPYRGGRSAAVTGIPGHPDTYYFGSTGGGVWKSEDGGTSWKNVSDGFFGGSIGAVEVSSWDPNVVYVGGGEKTVRGNVSHGDGLWKSTDAGRTWTYKGLPESRHIPRIRIHPKNPDLVYVAALGHLFGPNEERGVYRSKDGGETWEKILFVNEHAGAVDLAMDPTNPRILYATFWRVLRTPWSLESGGEGSSIWKTTDGGDTWEELTRNPGLPKGTIGISGIAVSASNPDNLYAIVEAENGGVFRSKDAGKTWTKTNSERSLRQRAWYYTRIYADPADEESVYVLNVRFHHSKDGGKTFSQISTPHGDNHDLWIAPEDPKRMIEGNDGGANVSYDGGETWSTQANQPTAQMYRVSTDNAFPYRLLGGQQDNSTVRIRSRSFSGSAIGIRDWEPTAGGESGHVVAKPDDPDVVYGGSYGGFLVRVDHETGEVRAVNVWPDNPMGWGAKELRYRFQWNYPIFFSPHDPDVLYAAANVLFKSTDEGASWRAISPDLTRDDESKQGPSGGPITKDNTSVEYYATIFAALESPHQAGVLWTGSDDGVIHLSRDGGNGWENVTPRDFPQWLQINSIEAHPFEPGGLYVAGTRYKLDDFKPYLYKTTDWGQTWTKITDGIPDDHFTRVIRADPDRRGLLYAGTERGVYVSFDDGGSWQPLQLELPVVPVTDLAVKEKDLVAATQGRGFWILDDLSPLHQLSDEIAAAPVHLFQPRATHRLRGGQDDEPGTRGTNPPSGVVFHYSLAEEIGGGEADEGDTQDGDVGDDDDEDDDEADGEEDGDEDSAADDEPVFRLEILEQDGDVIRTLVRKPAEGEEGEGDGEDRGDSDTSEELPLLTGEKGLNRVVWDLRYPGAETFPGLVLWNRFLDGPRAVPGTYRARLTVGDQVSETTFEVLPDPRSSSDPEDYQAQFDFLVQVRDKLTETHREIGRIREVRKQLDAVKKQRREAKGDDEEGEADPVVEAAKALDEAMTEIEEALYQTKNQSRQDPLNFPIRLNDKLAGVLRLAALGDFQPTDQMEEVRQQLTAAIDAELAKLDRIWREELTAFNGLAAKHGVTAVALPPAD